MQRDSNHPTICKIEKIINETPTVRTLIFSDEVLCNVLPGQFAMVWIPGVNEDLVCRDGTIFDGLQLQGNNEFGHTHRNKAGILENY